MKRVLFSATIGLVLISCSGQNTNEELNDQQSNNQNTEISEKENFTEFHELEIVNFINKEGKSSYDKLPISFDSFEFSKAGALYDESSKTLSIYFANFENPEPKYGMCCGQTEKEDQKTLSFIIKHENGNKIDRKRSFINFTDVSNFRGLNMIDRTMNGQYEMKDGYVEGEFTYVNDLDSTAFIKASFKLNLD